jgi:hypothetical protein
MPAKILFVVNTNGKFTAGVVDTGGNGIFDTGSKFAASIVDSLFINP